MKRFLIIFFMITFAISLKCNAKESSFYHIKPTKVIDGDTFHATHENYPIKVRLYGIDAPERGEVFFQEAKDALAETLADKERIGMELFYFDKYNRAVAIAYLGNGTTVQEELLSLGLVRISGEYCKIKLCDYWKEIERQAQGKKLAIWK